MTQSYSPAPGSPSHGATELPPVKGAAPRAASPSSTLHASQQQPGGGYSPNSTLEKRTFKDKLQQMILQAEMEQLQQTKEERALDKHTLAVSILVEGNPNAFVEFFNETHKPEPAPAATDDGSGQPGPAPESAELPLSSLMLMKEQLMRAEEAELAEDLESIYDSYRVLAHHFREMALFSYSIHYYTKCLELARAHGWAAGELEASTALGEAFEETEDAGAAVSSYERQLELATSSGNPEEEDRAYSNLVPVYMRQAETHEAAGESSAAAAAFHKCLGAAARAGDVAAQAKVHYRLGVLRQSEGGWDEALGHHRRFAELSAQVGDTIAEGLAYCAQAECHQATGGLDEAVSCLETYLELSKVADPQGQAVACNSLGILYYSQGKGEYAVMYFEKFHEIARSLANRKMQDTARINLGICRATLRLDKYVDVAAGSLPKLLQWKNARQPF